MPARDANRGRGGTRAGPGNRTGTAGGRQVNAGASAPSARGGASESATAQSAAMRGGESSGGRSSSRTTRREEPSRPSGVANARGGPVTAARSGGGSTSDPERTSERQRDVEPVRESRDAPGRAPLSPSAGRQPGTRAAERAQSSPGLSTWLAGADNPFAMMRRMEEDLDRVFRAFGIPRLSPVVAPLREFEDVLGRAPALAQAPQWSPQIEVFERDGNLVVRADLPGVKRDDVEVNVDDDVLTIRGERRQEHRETEGGYRRTERSYGTFFRRIPLPEGVDPDQVQASYQDGVLEVVVAAPPNQRRGRRRIEIR